MTRTGRHLKVATCQFSVSSDIDVNARRICGMITVMRQIVGGRADWQPAASTSETSRQKGRASTNNT